MTYCLPLFIVLNPINQIWQDIDDVTLFLCLGLSLAAICYYCYAIYAAKQFFSCPGKFDNNFHPPISILKPICGVDSKTYRNLASFCQQDYPEYQIIFGVQNGHDPSLVVVEQIIADFPQLDIQFVIGDRSLGTNRKVSNLSNAVVKAKHEILVLADSDVRVRSNYLKQVVQPLSQPQVGVVTCLYRSQSPNWFTKLENLNIPVEFHPGVLVSNQLEGIQFAMGQTIVIRRAVLDQIGGFAAIADFLADDFQLGYLPVQAGYQVVLSQHIVEHIVAASSLAESLHRQMRWMLVIRVSRPWGYVGLIFTYGTVTSLLFMLATAGSALGWTVLGLVWTLRLFMGWFIGVKHLKDPIAKQLFWLLPLRDLISFGLWCYGFVGNTIEWRGHQFKLTKEGKLVSFASSSLPKGVKSVVN
jgi:ceramide glucosyltransferase